ncbi:hypothetical protein CRP01_18710 [Flavilitoribacter nigricans DSM 23189 = NBRC 102662]|uniref:Uncharacterized protein n=1 Tax=Flavilitoribacter nigricans (strain ATCC 23147 / DSM 23189 / NBRC 102662 / NCIMB 1420 / SS-2) TaxID=1122177 RepID=A0A2D0N9A1_FLAN2|nr:hypothetical protein CRP01_18710 [Flavilitoribacter nigricans DSM 23189 = NBRC 102662]
MFVDIRDAGGQGTLIQGCRNRARSQYLREFQRGAKKNQKDHFPEDKGGRKFGSPVKFYRRPTL